MNFKDKDLNRPPVEKRHSFGPNGQGSGNGGGSNGHFSPFHGHGQTRARQSLVLTFLRILACAPGLLGLMYSLSTSWDNKFFDQEQQRHQNQEGSYQSIGDDDTILMRSDFWIASIVALAHLISWVLIGIIVTSRPVTEPTRPWVFITFIQGLLVFVIVYLPRFRAQTQATGFTKLSERLSHHVLEDGFMGREITSHSATCFLVLPFVVVGLCSWMLVITRGDHGYGQNRNAGGISQDMSQSSMGQLPTNIMTGSFLNEADQQDNRMDNRMVISMIVLSSATPQGYVNRQMFRETTLKLFPSPRNKAVVVKYRFIIGNSMPALERDLEQEHNVMGDLLIVSAPDRPDSKPRKLYKAIEWANQFDFDYLVKTEDDVLVRMDTLSGELYKQGKKEYFWKGLVFKNVPNTRLDDLDLKEMPMFTDGTLTTLSRDIVRLLAIPAPRYFVASSAQSLGIWLHGYGIRPEHDTRIQPGAFVCEEDLIAKHFDNESSLLLHPREDPIRMVERINLIRAELKRNKNNRNFRTTIPICDPLIQKRCAMCYSCQGRASNWKLMGFDCKQGGVIVGDKYRKPDLLDAKQMDELLNRPSSGVLEELGPIILKDYRPESRARQQLQSTNRGSSQPMGETDSEEIIEENTEEINVEEGGAGESGINEDNGKTSEEEQGEEILEETLEGQNEEEALDGVEGQDQDQEQEREQEQEQEQKPEQEQEQEQNQDQEVQDGTDHDHHDESEITISDQEVDYLDRRHDEESLPTKFEPSATRNQKAPKKKKKAAY
ncbi:hypothetical protein BGZ65_003587 [Modicella reniformis]|uniref:Uncharacterized protein n=1 Tax=Modicella reniformis TaxID=1440133 RepID=A0A9P6STH4_9FUNG|nr:hypothetical protein BGZ65_003587 [Modicella reniformis]